MNPHFAKADVLAACETYGPQLQVPEGLDGAGVMAALSSNESSVGFDCGPRHEPAYDLGGSLAVGEQQSLLSQYGATAAASYGPWQMMFINFTPEVQSKIATHGDELIDYAQEFVRWFNRYVIRVRKATNLDQIGQVWNLGHIGPDPVYTSKLEAAYDGWKAGTL